MGSASLILIFITWSWIVVIVNASDHQPKLSDYDSLRVDDGKHFPIVKNLHLNWYGHSIKAIIGQLGRDLYRKLPPCSNGPIYAATEAISNAFKSLEADLTPEQIIERDHKGFAFMERHQMEKLYRDQGVDVSSVSSDLDGYANLTNEDRIEALWSRIERIALNVSDESLARSKRQISWISVSSPLILAPFMFAPGFGLAVLGPVILSPGIFSPFVMNAAALSPYILSPGVAMPFILSPYLLGPYILSPLVLAPFILTPYVLSPNILNPYLLSPLILSPLALCPDILSPQVLGGPILSPSVLSPAILTDSYLVANILSPTFLS
uniref:DUF2207 domain-containing protein n=1 Tax=Panagrellus redivivus TaxID=6233 RepID=A0A7E4V9S2_PANRE